MSGSRPVRFPVRFDPTYRVVSSSLLLAPSRSYVELDGEWVTARMSWAFRTRFPRAAVTSVQELPSRPLSRGVHGFSGRWLVNGSGRDILQIELSPDQRAYVLGFPVRLRQLLVSVERPDALAKALLCGPGSKG
jgi:hypothetical protein